MPQENFFTDPKVWISLLAIIISIVNIGYTITNQYEQNKKWNALNEGAIQIKETRMTIWKQIDANQVIGRRWIADNVLYRNEFNPSTYRIINCVMFFDSTTGRILDGSNYCTSDDEMNVEITKLNLRPPFNAHQMFRPVFKFENVGKTKASNLKVDIYYFINNEYVLAETLKAELYPTQTIVKFIDIFLPTDGVLPTIAKFKFDISYQTAISEYQSFYYVSWFKDRDRWSYPSVEEKN